MPGPDPTPARHRGDLAERLSLLHVGAFVVFTSWAFGGQAPFARTAIAWWGTVGMVLFLWNCATSVRPPEGRLHPALRWLWPLWLYDGLVITSCFNPAFAEVTVEGTRMWRVADPVPWLPSAARPGLAIRELWQFNGLVLSTCNLALVAARRTRLRMLLFVIGGNALALAIFGTFQKLAGSTGLWFGLVPSPQPRFFSTFIYHNHWGSFILLCTAACLGLFFHYQRRGGHRDLWHSPVLLGAVSILLLATTVPLSASRSCTALMALLLGASFAHVLVRVIRHRRAARRSALVPVAGLVLVAVLAVSAIGFLGRGAIVERARQTSAQLAGRAEAGTTIASRLTLYRDTWHMAMDRPWFGWGLESYASVFPIYNSQRPVERWFPPPRYAEAHNDWFQSLAETGFVGTGLLAALFLSVLASLPWRASSTLPRYLLAGVVFLLLYAWIEFPFANPAVTLTFCTVFFCAVRYAILDARAPSAER